MYPIEFVIPDVINQLKAHNTVVLQAPPGAGKSTILPLALMEHHAQEKKILMLEPRRLAARSVALRMSELITEDIGQSVGYRIRFDNMISSRTKLEVVTEGVLVSMLHADPALEDYSMVIFDEFHERSLYADLGLALTRQAQSMLRNDLRILVMSATIDTARLSDMLHAPVITSEGKMHPVELIYQPENRNKRLDENAADAIHDAFTKYEGDLLVFLPGAPEIRHVAQRLEDLNGLICPLYGDLSINEQHKAILPDPSGRRKVVLATSIAETSLTIEGIRVVIDAGYSRHNRYDPSSGLNRLITVRVTKDTADQRAGRAGRTGPGTCIRLWSELEQSHLNPSRKPELEEADLSSLLLDLARWGDMDPSSYEWLTPPPLSSLNSAKEVLVKTGAIDGNKITEKGMKMSVLPAHPRIAHMLTDASADELPVAIDLACLLEEKDPAQDSTTVNISSRVDLIRKFRSGERVNASTSLLQRINRSCMHWAKLMNVKLSTVHVNEHLCGKLLTYAYPERIARKVSGNRYRLANGRSAMLQDHDELSREEWISVANMDASRESGKIYYAAPVDKSDLYEMAIKTRSIAWSESKQLIEAAEELKIGPLVLVSRMIHEITEEQRVSILTEQLKKQGLRFLGELEKLNEFKARIASLRIWNAEMLWPEVSEEALTNDTSWIEPYLTNIRKKTDLDKLDPATILKNSLDYDLQQKLDKLAPETIQVPSGSSIKLEYFEDGKPPVLAVRLQELFGLFETPLINNGKQKVLIHLLSPGYKPVQVTQDLRSFWTNTYKEVRKELKIRYSKHFWPEDPFTAEAVRGVKRR